jgi:hypothetical protein
MQRIMETNLQQAMKEQYHAGLAMLADCVAKCPDDMWTQGAHPRPFWRIAFHTAFFTHLYMGQAEADFAPWPGRREGIHHRLWESPADVEPYDLPEEAEIYTRGELLDYIRYVDSLVDTIVDALDLTAPATGFSWYDDYGSMSKLSHELMNLRHIQGHVGQLSELLMARGIDTDWIGARPKSELS